MGNIHSIKFRFTMWYLMILSVLLVLLAAGIYTSLSRTLYGNFDDALRSRSAQLSGFKDIISIVASGTFENEIGELVSFYYDEGNRLKHISQSRADISIDPATIRNAIGGKSTFTTIRSESDTALRVFAVPFVPDTPDIKPEKYSASSGKGRSAFPKQIREAALVVGRPITDIEAACRQLLHILLFALPITLVIAGGGGVFLAQRAFRPVEKITETAREIEATDLSRRIAVTSKDELGHLASTLNQMIARLEKAFLRQKEFTGDASHELRAPLSVIQAESSLALQRPRSAEEYQRSLEIITQETEHLASIVGQLLALARADAGKMSLNFRTINLSDLMKDLCTEVEILCVEKTLSLKRKFPDGITVNGDTGSLRSLFQNILANAVRYTPEGGRIIVSLHREKTMVRVSIEDTGIGIPAEEQSQIFERFYRVDKARSRGEGGSGLGLAICRQIADNHGAAIEVESRPGKGSIFHIKLPAG
jgi:heavy metal sensor kinase